MVQYCPVDHAYAYRKYTLLNFSHAITAAISFPILMFELSFWGTLKVHNHHGYDFRCWRNLPGRKPCQLIDRPPPPMDLVPRTAS